MLNKQNKLATIITQYICELCEKIVLWMCNNCSEVSSWEYVSNEDIWHTQISKNQ